MSEFYSTHNTKTYFTVTLVDRSWRSPGWKSCASFSPSFPQALRKTLRLSWTENKVRDDCCPPVQGQRIITQKKGRKKKTPWQGAAYNWLLPKFRSPQGTAAGREERLSAANKKWPGVQHSRAHRDRWKRRRGLPDMSWVTAAKPPVGWIRVGTKPKRGRMTSEPRTSPTQHAMQVQKWRTKQHMACCCCCCFSHPETVPSPPCQAFFFLFFFYSKHTWGVFWRHTVATKHEVGWQGQTAISL